jgi:hypothetical protein
VPEINIILEHWWNLHTARFSKKVKKLIDALLITMEKQESPDVWQPTTTIYGGSSSCYDFWRRSSLGL